MIHKKQWEEEIWDKPKLRDYGQIKGGYCTEHNNNNYYYYN